MSIERLTEALRPACLALLLLTAAGAQNATVPFRTFTVLPAVNETGDNKPGGWSVTWQYLLQERLRELGGLQVIRFTSAPELMEQFQAGKLDVAKVATRNEIAQQLGVDLLLAPVMIRGGDEWEVRADLIDPAQGPKPIAEIPPAVGSLPTAVTDQLLVGVLKAALGKDATLPPYKAVDFDDRDFQILTGALWQWPYTSPDDAKRGALDKAEALLDRVAPRGQAKLWLIYQRFAQTKIAAGKAKEAVTALQPWIRGNRRDPRAALVIGQLYTAAGRDAEAKDYLVAAAEESKGSLPAVTALAEHYRRVGDLDKALAQYEQAAAIWPNVRPFRSARGQLALDSHRYDVAVKAYTAYVQLAPSDPEGYRGLTKALVGARRLPEALAAAQQLALLTPDDLSAQRLLATTALTAESFEVAMAAAEKLTVADPKDGGARALLGQAQLALGEAESAEQNLAAAAELSPEDFTIHRDLALARLYLPEPNYEGAVQAFGAALKVAPDVERPGLQMELARANLYWQKYEPALQAARAAQALMPLNPAPDYLAAEIHLFADQPVETIAELRRAFEKDTAAAAGQTLLARLEAIEADRQGFDNLRLALGYLLQASGRNRDAWRKYSEYLASPSAETMGDWVRERLAELETAGLG